MSPTELPAQPHVIPNSTPNCLISEQGPRLDEPPLAKSQVPLYGARLPNVQPIQTTRHLVDNLRSSKTTEGIWGMGLWTPYLQVSV